MYNAKKDRNREKEGVGGRERPHSRTQVKNHLGGVWAEKTRHFRDCQRYDLLKLNTKKERSRSGAVSGQKGGFVESEDERGDDQGRRQKGDGALEWKRRHSSEKKKDGRKGRGREFQWKGKKESQGRGSTNFLLKENP